MSKSYDIFLSHSGAQKEFVEQLYTELTRQYGHYSVFYDEDSIKHGESISSSILEYAKMCKLAVAVLSEEYFTRSKPPMLELAASFKASKDGTGVPCLLPVFFELRPEHAKDFDSLKSWKSTWEEWRRNEIMSTRIPYKSRPNKVEPQIWKDALSKLLDTRGPVYVPHENKNKSEVFARKAARVIVGKLDELSKTKVSYKATDLSDSLDMEHLSIWGGGFDGRVEYPDSPLLFDRRERASTSGETHVEFECSSCLEYTEREEYVAECERLVEVLERIVRLVEVRERDVGEREEKVEVREFFVDERERNLLGIEADLTELQIRRNRDDKTVLPDWLYDHRQENINPGANVA